MKKNTEPVNCGKPAADLAADKQAYVLALEVAVRALALYADPSSYHALTVLGDEPCGWFSQDTGETGHFHYRRKMHGAEARRALEKIAKLIRNET